VGKIVAGSCTECNYRLSKQWVNFQPLKYLHNVPVVHNLTQTSRKYAQQKTQTILANPRCLITDNMGILSKVHVHHKLPSREVISRKLNAVHVMYSNPLIISR